MALLVLMVAALTVCGFIGALAADSDVTEVGSYDDLVAALANGGNIVLTTDIVAPDKATLKLISGTTLDLGGHSLTINGESGSMTDSTIQNGTIEITTYEGDTVADGLFDTYGTNTVTNVTIHSVKSAIYAIFDIKTGTLDITASTIDMANNNSAGGLIYFNGGDSLTMTNCVVDATDVGDFISNGTVVIADSVINLKGTTEGTLDNGINGAALTLTDTELNIDGATDRGITTDGDDIVINGTSSVTLTDCAEGGVRYKAPATIKIEETSSLVGTVKVDSAAVTGEKAATIAIISSSTGDPITTETPAVTSETLPYVAATNGTVTTVATPPSGTITPAYTYADRIAGNATASATDAVTGVAVQLYEGSKLIATSTLTDTALLSSSMSFAWNMHFDNSSSTWNVVWEASYPDIAMQPTKVVLLVDNVVVASNVFKFTDSDDLNPIVAAAEGSDGFKGYYTSLTDASADVTPGDTVCLVADTDEAFLFLDGVQITTLDGVSAPNVGNYVATITVDNTTTYYKTLADAFAAANGNTVVLATDITDPAKLVAGGAVSAPNSYNCYVYIDEGETVVLDLNGYKIAVVDPLSDKNFAIINNHGTLTICDNSASQTGAIIVTSASKTSDDFNSAVLVNRGGTMTVNSGTIEHQDLAYSTTNTFAIENMNNSYGDTTLIINGGNIIASQATAIRIYTTSPSAQAGSGAAYFTMTGGSVKGYETGIWLLPTNNSSDVEATVIIEGGTITADIDAFYSNIHAKTELLNTTISGGTFTGTVSAKDGEIAITGGTFNSDVIIKNADKTVATSSDAISGGTFNAGVNTNYLASSANTLLVVCVTDADGSATVYSFDTIDDALAALESVDATATVNVSFCKALKVTASIVLDRDMIIDGNGYTISSNVVAPITVNADVILSNINIINTAENGEAIALGAGASLHAEPTTVLTASTPFSGYTVGQTITTTDEALANALNTAGYALTAATVDGVTTYTVVTNAPKAALNGWNYDTFANALADAVANDTITLLDDLTVDSTISISKDIAIDGGNFTITSTASTAVFTLNASLAINNVAIINNVATAPAFQLGADVDLTIGSNTAINSAIILGGYDSVSHTHKVTVGSVALSAALEAEGYYMVNNGDGTYTVSEHAVAKIGNTLYHSFADAMAAAVDGDTIIILQNLELTDTVVIDKKITIYGHFTLFKSTDDTAVFSLGENASLTINCEIEKADGAKVLAAWNGQTVKTNDVTVRDLLNAEGYAMVEEATGVWTVKTAMAKIGTTNYASLADALAAAVDGNTIVLLDDATLTETANISITLTIDGAYTVEEGGATVTKYYTVTSAASTTFLVSDNLTVNCKVENTYGATGAAFTMSNSGIVAINGDVTTAGKVLAGYAQGQTVTTTVADVATALNDEGYALELASGVYTVVTDKPEAVDADGKYYETLEKALAAGATEITLLSNVTVEATINVSGTLTIKGDYTLTSTAASAFKLATDATLNLNCALVATDVLDATGGWNVSTTVKAVAEQLNAEIAKTITEGTGADAITINLGYALELADGVYTVVSNEPEAAIGGWNYKTLEKAIASATNGQTIDMLRSIETSSNNMNIVTNITLDGHGFELYSTNGTGNAGLRVVNATAVIKNLKLTTTAADALVLKHESKQQAGAYTKATLIDCTVTSARYGLYLYYTTAADLVVENSIVDATSYGVYVNNSTGNVTVLGATSSITAQNDAIRYTSSNGDVTVKDGATVTVTATANDKSGILYTSNSTGNIVISGASTSVNVTSNSAGRGVRIESAPVNVTIDGATIVSDGSAVSVKADLVLKNDSSNASLITVKNGAKLDDAKYSVYIGGGSSAVEVAYENLSYEALHYVKRSNTARVWYFNDSLAAALNVKPNYVDGTNTVYVLNSITNFAGATPAYPCTIDGNGNSVTAAAGKTVFTLSDAIATLALNDITIVADAILGNYVQGTNTVTTNSEQVANALNAEGYALVKSGDIWTITAAKGAPEAQVNGWNYATFKEAYDAAPAGGTITLLNNIDLGTATFQIKKTLTIVGNGKADGCITISGAPSDRAILRLLDGANLTLESVRIQSTANWCLDIGASAQNTDANDYTVIIKNSKIISKKEGIQANGLMSGSDLVLTLDGSDLVNDSSTGIYVRPNVTTCTINVQNGSTISTTGTAISAGSTGNGMVVVDASNITSATSHGLSVYFTNFTVIVRNDSHVKGGSHAINTNASIKSGILNVSDTSTIETTGSGKYGVIHNDGAFTINVKDSAQIISKDSYAIYLQKNNDSKVILEGNGILKGSAAVHLTSAAAQSAVDFTKSTKYGAYSKVTDASGNVTYSLYDTLANAASGTVDGAEIHLFKNVTVTAAITISKNVVIYGNGHKITNTGTDYTLKLKANATISDITISSETGMGIEVSWGSAYVLQLTGSDISVADVALYLGSTKPATITATTLISAETGKTKNPEDSRTVYMGSTSNATFTNCTIKNTGEFGTAGTCCFYLANNSTVVLTLRDTTVIGVNSYGILSGTDDNCTINAYNCTLKAASIAICKKSSTSTKSMTLNLNDSVIVSTNNDHAIAINADANNSSNVTVTATLTNCAFHTTKADGSVDTKSKWGLRIEGAKGSTLKVYGGTYHVTHDAFLFRDHVDAEFYDVSMNGTSGWLVTYNQGTDKATAGSFNLYMASCTLDSQFRCINYTGGTASTLESITLIDTTLKTRESNGTIEIDENAADATGSIVIKIVMTKTVAEQKAATPAVPTFSSKANALTLNAMRGISVEMSNVWIDSEAVAVTATSEGFSYEATGCYLDANADFMTVYGSNYDVAVNIKNSTVIAATLTGIYAPDLRDGTFTFENVNMTAARHGLNLGNNDKLREATVTMIDTTIYAGSDHTNTNTSGIKHEHGDLTVVMTNSFFRIEGPTAIGIRSHEGNLTVIMNDSHITDLVKEDTSTTPSTWSATAGSTVRGFYKSLNDFTLTMNGSSSIATTSHHAIDVAAANGGLFTLVMNDDAHVSSSADGYEAIIIRDHSWVAHITLNNRASIHATGAALKDSSNNWYGGSAIRTYAKQSTDAAHTLKITLNMDLVDGAISTTPHISGTYGGIRMHNHHYVEMTFVNAYVKSGAYHAVWKSGHEQKELVGTVTQSLIASNSLFISDSNYAINLDDGDTADKDGEIYSDTSRVTIVELTNCSFGGSYTGTGNNVTLTTQSRHGIFAKGTAEGSHIIINGGTYLVDGMMMQAQGKCNATVTDAILYSKGEGVDYGIYMQSITLELNNVDYKFYGTRKWSTDGPMIATAIYCSEGSSPTIKLLNGTTFYSANYGIRSNWTAANYVGSENDGNCINVTIIMESSTLTVDGLIGIYFNGQAIGKTVLTLDASHIICNGVGASASARPYAVRLDDSPLDATVTNFSSIKAEGAFGDALYCTGGRVAMDITMTDATIVAAARGIESQYQNDTTITLTRTTVTAGENAIHRGEEKAYLHTVKITLVDCALTGKTGAGVYVGAVKDVSIHMTDSTIVAGAKGIQFSDGKSSASVTVISTKAVNETKPTIRVTNGRGIEVQGDADTTITLTNVYVLAHGNAVHRGNNGAERDLTVTLTDCLFIATAAGDAAVYLGNASADKFGGELDLKIYRSKLYGVTRALQTSGRAGSNSEIYVEDSILGGSYDYVDPDDTTKTKTVASPGTQSVNLLGQFDATFVSCTIKSARFAFEASGSQATGAERSKLTVKGTAAKHSHVEGDSEGMRIGGSVDLTLEYTDVYANGKDTYKNTGEKDADSAAIRILTVSTNVTVSLTSCNIHYEDAGIDSNSLHTAFGYGIWISNGTIPTISIVDCNVTVEDSGDAFIRGGSVSTENDTQITLTRSTFTAPGCAFGITGPNTTLTLKATDCSFVGNTNWGIRLFDSAKNKVGCVSTVELKNCNVGGTKGDGTTAVTKYGVLVEGAEGTTLLIDGGYYYTKNSGIQMRESVALTLKNADLYLGKDGGGYGVFVQHNSTYEESGVDKDGFNEGTASIYVENCTISAYYRGISYQSKDGNDNAHLSFMTIINTTIDMRAQSNVVTVETFSKTVAPTITWRMDNAYDLTKGYTGDSKGYGARLVSYYVDMDVTFTNVALRSRTDHAISAYGSKNYGKWLDITLIGCYIDGESSAIFLDMAGNIEITDSILISQGARRGTASNQNEASVVRLSGVQNSSLKASNTDFIQNWIDAATVRAIWSSNGTCRFIELTDCTITMNSTKGEAIFRGGSHFNAPGKETTTDITLTRCEITAPSHVLRLEHSLMTEATIVFNSCELTSTGATAISIANVPAITVKMTDSSITCTGGSNGIAITGGAARVELTNSTIDSKNHAVVVTSDRLISFCEQHSGKCTCAGKCGTEDVDCTKCKAYVTATAYIYLDNAQLSALTAHPVQVDANTNSEAARLACFAIVELHNESSLHAKNTATNNGMWLNVPSKVTVIDSTITATKYSGFTVAYDSTIHIERSTITSGSDGNAILARRATTLTIIDSTLTAAGAAIQFECNNDTAATGTGKYECTVSISGSTITSANNRAIYAREKYESNKHGLAHTLKTLTITDSTLTAKSNAVDLRMATGKSSTISVTGCKITSANDCGFYFSTGSIIGMTLKDTEITAKNEIALFDEKASAVTIENCKLTSTNRTCLRIDAATDDLKVSITDSTLISRAKYGLVCYGTKTADMRTTIDIENSYIEGYVYGILLRYSVDLTLTDCDLVAMGKKDSDADKQSAAVRFSSNDSNGTLVATNCTFTQHYIDAESGASGIFTSNGTLTKAEMTNCTVTVDENAPVGFAFWRNGSAFNSPAKETYGTYKFIGCTFTSPDDGVRMNHSAMTQYTVEITNTVITTTTNSNAVFFGANSIAHVDLTIKGSSLKSGGDAIKFYEGTEASSYTNAFRGTVDLTIEDSSLIATTYGAVYMPRVTGLSLSVKDSYIEGNTFGLYMSGGNPCVCDKFEVINSTVIGKGSYGIRIFGNKTTNEKSLVTISNSYVEGYQYGVWVRYAVDVTIEDSTLVSQGGGAGESAVFRISNNDSNAIVYASNTEFIQNRVDATTVRAIWHSNGSLTQMDLIDCKVTVNGDRGNAVTIGGNAFNFPAEEDWCIANFINCEMTAPNQAILFENSSMTEATINIVGGTYITNDLLLRAGSIATVNVYGGYFQTNSGYALMNVIEYATLNIYGGRFINNVPSTVNDSWYSVLSLGTGADPIDQAVINVYGGHFEAGEHLGQIFRDLEGRALNLYAMTCKGAQYILTDGTPAEGILMEYDFGTNTYSGRSPVMYDGAQLRLVQTGKGTGGIRFVTKIDKATMDYAKFMTKDDASIAYGTLIVPLDYLMDENGNWLVGDFSVASLEAAGLKYLNIVAKNGIIENADGSITLLASISEIKEQNYDRKFAAIGYVKYDFNGMDQYLYSAFDPEDNARSLKEIASKALNDVSETQNATYRYEIADGFYSRYTDEQRELLAKYVGCQVTEEIIKAPTATEAGLKRVTCTVCGTYYEEVILPLGEEEITASANSSKILVLGENLAASLFAIEDELENAGYGASLIGATNAAGSFYARENGSWCLDATVDTVEWEYVVLFLDESHFDENGALTGEANTLIDEIKTAYSNATVELIYPVMVL